MNKLDQLAKALDRHGLLYRSYNGLPKNTSYPMRFDADGLVTFWNGTAEPLNLGAAVGDIWYNGMNFQRRIADKWVPIDSYESSFPSTMVFLGDNFDQVTRFVVSAEIQGPKMLGPNRNHVLYTLKTIWSDDTAEISPANWTLQPVEPNNTLPIGTKMISAHNGKGNLSTGTPVLDTKMRIIAQYGSRSDTMDIVVTGTKAEVVASAMIKLDGPLNLIEGTRGQYRATIQFPDGTVESPAATDFTWTLIPDGLATVSESGLVTADSIDADTNVVLKVQLTGKPEVQAATRTITIREGLITEQSAPFFGVSTPGETSAAFIQGMKGRGTAGTRTGSFSVKAVANQKVYYAYPASMGLARFTNTKTNTTGGFDIGVDPETQEPRVVSVPDGQGGSVDFYLYESNLSGLGAVEFTVS